MVAGSSPLKQLQPKLESRGRGRLARERRQFRNFSCSSGEHQLWRFWIHAACRGRGARATLLHL